MPLKGTFHVPAVGILLQLPSPLDEGGGGGEAEGGGGGGGGAPPPAGGERACQAETGAGKEYWLGKESGSLVNRGRSG